LRELVFEIGDPALELRHPGEPLLGNDQQLGELVAFGGYRRAHVGIGVGHEQEATRALVDTIGDMPQVAIVMPGSRSPLTDELAAILRHELNLQGVPAEPFSGAFPEARLGQVYVLLDPLGWMREYGSPAASLLRATIVLFEQAPAAPDEPLLELLDGAGAVFVTDARQAVGLQRLAEVHARVMRAGYSERLDRCDPDADRPIDVAVTGGGAEGLDDISTALGFRAHVAERGASRLQLLSNAKVAINVHDGPESQLEWRRVLDAVHCGAVVVTEHSDGIAPLTVGEHLLVGSRASLPHIAGALLRDPERLARIRLAAYDRLRTWMPYALPVSVLRAAIVELVGEPVPVIGAAGRELTDDLSAR
jgi:hypothetical protein